MSFPFSPETLEALTKAGWSPDRKVDVEQWRTILEKTGCKLFPKAVDFLSCYGGLQILEKKYLYSEPRSAIRNWEERGSRYDSRTPYVPSPYLTALTPNTAIALYKGVPPEDIVLDFRERLEQEICIIGELFDTSISLIMSEDGRVWAHDQVFTYVAESGEQAIEDMFMGGGCGGELLSFSYEVFDALMKTGWTPRRWTDTKPYKEFHERLGLSDFSNAFYFLGSFGGMAIEYPLPGKGNYPSTNVFVVDPLQVKGAEVRLPQWKAQLGETLSKFLTILGHIENGTIPLLMASDRSVWMDNGELIKLVSDGDGGQVIDYLLMGRLNLTG